MDIGKQLAALDLDPKTFSSGDLVARSPIDGSVTARIAAHDSSGVDAAIGRAARRVPRVAERAGAEAW